MNKTEAAFQRTGYGYSRAQRELYQRVKARTGTIEQLRWEHAADAQDAMERKIAYWAEIIGAACGREPSTIYEWRRAWAVRKSVNPKSRLSISYWVTAANGVSDDNSEEVLHWLYTCERDAKITIESARAQFPRKAKAEAEAAPLRESVLAVCDTLTDLTDRADFPEGAEMFVRLALRAMTKLLERLAERVTA